MPLQWLNQFWQNLEEGSGKRCSESDCAGRRWMKRSLLWNFVALPLPPAWPVKKASLIHRHVDSQSRQPGLTHFADRSWVKGHRCENLSRYLHHLCGVAFYSFIHPTHRGLHYSVQQSLAICMDCHFAHCSCLAE